jgi:hypothetical protein
VRSHSGPLGVVTRLGRVGFTLCWVAASFGEHAGGVVQVTDAERKRSRVGNGPCGLVRGSIRVTVLVISHERDPALSVVLLGLLGLKPWGS